MSSDSILDFTDLAAGFSILSGGLVLAVLVALVERCMLSNRNKNPRNRVSHFSIIHQSHLSVLLSVCLSFDTLSHGITVNKYIYIWLKRLTEHCKIWYRDVSLS